MAESGLHIPANENSNIYVFDKIFASIGDEQSIQESLSTFSSHMLNIIEILNSFNENSLILLDELGSGTDPIEGSSLAISILEHLYKNGPITLSTTHYPEIKNYALITDGFENASCEFDIENLKPTYKLLVGIPGKSNAFAISKRLGLQDDILNRANELLTTDHINIEELLKSIYDNKLQIENEKELIDKNLNQVEVLRNSLEIDLSTHKQKEREIIEKAKEEARKILLKAKEEAHDIIKELNELPESIDSLKEANNLRNKLNSSLKDYAPKLQESTSSNLEISDIKIGMTVLVKSLNTKATILSLPNKSSDVLLQLGNAKMTMNVKELEIAKQDTVKHIPQKKNINLKAKNISSEINVIGQNVEEAIFVIDKYLDDCSLAKISPVRIVHGKGTGKLRQGIHSFLKTHPHVKSYRLGSFGEGEMGVTVVEIK
ncbi:MAG: Smr/MutS family protein [Clostridia bacterium]|nr:Smr/MutS family protein [Clostridia bacterium]